MSMMMEPESRRQSTNDAQQTESKPGASATEDLARPTIPQIKDGLRELLENIENQSFPRELHIGTSTIQAADIASDVHDFKLQKEVFEVHGIPHFAVTMENRTGSILEDMQSVSVLIKVPDLGRPMESYSFLVSDLERSGLDISQVESSEANDVFLSRLSEFVSSRANVAGQVAPLVTVHSNRRGDTVLYAKGYFLSTGTAFGISTPATGTLEGGRYSFGILESGSPKFEKIVWQIPENSEIKLDLP
jgi:hypothetical protein